MDIKPLTSKLSVSSQIVPDDLSILAAEGYSTVIANRPDREGADQPDSDLLAETARAQGLSFHYLPVHVGETSPEAALRFSEIVNHAPGKVLAFCRSGARSAALWDAGAAHRRQMPAPAAADVVIVGGGSAGIAVAASLLRRRPELDIVIVEPGDVHSYQPGWTMVGGGVFNRAQTQRPMADVMPKGVRWLKSAVTGFTPEANSVTIADGGALGYRALIVAAGLALDWDGIPGLKHALGRNGVTSNYRADLAPYTWELVQALRQGRALFTQPSMPIKCAGAPQKALYLSCDYWLRNGRIGAIRPEFHTVTPALFGVAHYVPALMGYIEKYQVNLQLESKLIAIDGDSRRARFQSKNQDGSLRESVEDFDMLHVCPPQIPPAFVKASPLANAAGWVDVDQETLRHAKFENVFSLGDVCSTTNAKTAAAARKQAPVVAENALSMLDGEPLRAIYDGYGSCPLTVERGKIVLAEFGYGGKLLPTFPKAIIDGAAPSRLAWLLKEKGLPFIYWNAMLKGREWLAEPAHRAQ